MTPWLVLLPVAVFMCWGAWLSYDPVYRLTHRFAAVLVMLSIINGLLWVVACRWCESSRQLFAVGVAWDAVTILSYTLLPLVLCGVRLSGVAWLGLGFVVFGACLVKWSE